jgi:hypothetical protein
VLFWRQRLQANGTRVSCAGAVRALVDTRLGEQRLQQQECEHRRDDQDAPHRHHAGAAAGLLLG